MSVPRSHFAVLSSLIIPPKHLGKFLPLSSPSSLCSKISTCWSCPSYAPFFEGSLPPQLTLQSRPEPFSADYLSPPSFGSFQQSSCIGLTLCADEAVSIALTRPHHLWGPPEAKFPFAHSFNDDTPNSNRTQQWFSLVGHALPFQSLRSFRSPHEGQCDYSVTYRAPMKPLHPLTHFPPLATLTRCSRLVQNFFNLNALKVFEASVQTALFSFPGRNGGLWPGE